MKKSKKKFCTQLIFRRASDALKNYMIDEAFQNINSKAEYCDL